MNLVVDTSAIVAALKNDGDLGVWSQAYMSQNQLVAPAGVDLEVLAALRGVWRGGRMSERAASVAIGRFGRMHILKLHTNSLHQRIWELRDNLTSYDAAFVALAERLSAPLLTCDLPMARASGTRCEFITP
jgi:predicted nucleic acid-binding protein